MHPYRDKGRDSGHSRVAKITKGYAKGGPVFQDQADERAPVLGKPSRALKSVGVAGKPAKARLDRPGFASGGSVKGKGKTDVTVIVSPNQPPPMQPPAMAPPAPPMAPPPNPHPSMPPLPLAGPPGGAPPGGMPPTGLPIRKHGGRVMVGAKADGIKNGTKVQPSPDKAIRTFASKPPKLTRKKGGRVHYDAGAGSAEGRLEKIGKEPKGWD